MVLPASIVPWRAIAPVRARIASSSVVLPLWNGPTSATQRGPTARAPLPPFVAIVTSRTASRGRTRHTAETAGSCCLKNELSFQRGRGPVKRKYTPPQPGASKLGLWGEADSPAGALKSCRAVSARVQKLFRAQSLRPDAIGNCIRCKYGTLLREMQLKRADTSGYIEADL